MPVPGVAGVGDLAGGDIQGGEQAGDAVPGVVVGLPLGDAAAHWQDRLAALEGLALRLFAGADHDRVFGRLQVEPTTSATFASSSLRTEQGLAALRAAAAAHLSPGGELQVATALDMLAAVEARMEVLRTQLRDAARHLTGAKVLAARLYGVGPVTALALTCWLAGESRFSSSRKAVRFTGLRITVWSSDRKGAPGRLSRQGPPMLRWAVYEAGKTHARAAAPDHGYYATVKDRKNSKRAALSEARKLVRQACHILAELGETRSPPPEPLTLRHGQSRDAPARAGTPQPHSPMGNSRDGRCGAGWQRAPGDP